MYRVGMYEAPNDADVLALSPPQPTSQPPPKLAAKGTSPPPPTPIQPPSTQIMMATSFLPTSTYRAPHPIKLHPPQYRHRLFKTRASNAIASTHTHTPSNSTVTNQGRARVAPPQAPPAFKRWSPALNRSTSSPLHQSIHLWILKSRSGKLYIQDVSSLYVGSPCSTV